MWSFLKTLQTTFLINHQITDKKKESVENFQQKTNRITEWITHSITHFTGVFFFLKEKLFFISFKTISNSLFQQKTKEKKKEKHKKKQNKKKKKVKEKKRKERKSGNELKKKSSLKKNFFKKSK